MNRWTKALSLAMILFGMAETGARAEMTVNIGSNLNVAAGSTTGTIDITVSGNNNDTLSYFDLELQITPIGTPSGILQFSTTQPLPFSNANYVFYNESTDADLSLPLWDVPAPPHLPNPFTTMSGGDSDDGTGPLPGYVNIPASPSGANSYMGTVQFDASGAVVGDMYSVSVVMAGSELDDANGDSVTFNSNPGTIGIIAAATVPEPSSVMMMAFSTLSGVLLFWGRRRQQRRYLPN